VAQVLSRGS